MQGLNVGVLTSIWPARLPSSSSCLTRALAAESLPSLSPDGWAADPGMGVPSPVTIMLPSSSKLKPGSRSKPPSSSPRILLIRALRCAELLSSPGKMNPPRSPAPPRLDDGIIRPSEDSWLPCALEILVRWECGDNMLERLEDSSVDSSREDRSMSRAGIARSGTKAGSSCTMS